MNFKNKSAVIWGDSVAKGVLWSEEKGRFVSIPHAAASIVSEKTGLSINNRSRIGMTSTEGLRLMCDDVDKGMRAEYAVIEFGGNDCDFLWKEISDDPSAHHDPKTLPEDYESNIKAMIKKARDNCMKPVLMTLPPINSDLYFDFISRGRSADNILSWLGDKGHIYRYHERYSAIVARLARECSCRLLDVRSAFLEKWDRSSLFCLDGIHPSEEGQKLMGEAILSGIV